MCSAGILTQLQSFRFVLSCTFFNPKGFKHIEAETRWPTFSRWHFQIHFLEWNVWILIKISQSLFTKGPINNIPALVQIMAWHRSGYKRLCESMMVSLLMHICITPPQWGKSLCRARYMAVYLGYTFQAMNTLFDMRDKLDKQDDSPLCQWLRRHGAASITKYEKMEAQGTDKPLEYTAGSTKRFEAYIDPENNFNMRDKLSQVGYAFFFFFNPYCLETTGECRYNAIQCGMILHTSLLFPRQNLNQWEPTKDTP